MAEKARRNEARARGIHVAVAIVALAMDKKPLRHDDMEVIARPRQRHVQKPPFLLDLRA